MIFSIENWLIDRREKAFKLMCRSGYMPISSNNSGNNSQLSYIVTRNKTPFCSPENSGCMIFSSWYLREIFYLCTYLPKEQRNSEIITSKITKQTSKYDVISRRWNASPTCNVFRWLSLRFWIAVNQQIKVDQTPSTAESINLLNHCAPEPER